MAEILERFSMVLFMLAVIPGILAVVFWFRFRIWEIVGEMSGKGSKNAKKNMEERPAGEPEPTEGKGLRMAYLENIVIVHTEEEIG